MKKEPVEVFSQDEEFYKGAKNISVRYYFYVQRGLSFVNEFRYLIMGILGIYYTLRLDNPWLIPIMFLVSLPILIFLGWIFVHHVAKIMEYLNIQHSTHWGRYQFKLWEDIRTSLDLLAKDRNDYKNLGNETKGGESNVKK